MNSVQMAQKLAWLKNNPGKTEADYQVWSDATNTGDGTWLQRTLNKIMPYVPLAAGAVMGGGLIMGAAGGAGAAGAGGAGTAWGAGGAGTAATGAGAAGTAGTVATAGGAAAPAAAGAGNFISQHPYLVGAGASLLGRAFPGSKSTTQTQTVTRPSTPVQVRLPSGATVTMYAHGPDSQTTNSKDTSKPGATGMISDGLDVAGWIQKYGGGFGGNAGGPGGVTQTQAPESGVYQNNAPDYTQPW